MHTVHCYSASLFLTAALVMPVAMMAAPAQHLNARAFSSEFRIQATRIITTGVTTKTTPGAVPYGK